MPLLQVVLVLIVIGVLLYLFDRFVTAINPTIKKIIIWLVIVCTILWLLNLVGAFDLLRNGPKVPRISR